MAGCDICYDVMNLVMALGLGWILLLGGAALATRCWRHGAQTRAQEALHFTVVLTMTVTPFSSGALVTTGGQSMNLARIVPLVVLASALAWLARQARGAQNPAA